MPCGVPWITWGRSIHRISEYLVSHVATENTSIVALTAAIASTAKTSSRDDRSDGCPAKALQKSSVLKTPQTGCSQTKYEVMILRKSTSSRNVIPQSAVLARSSRGSLFETGRFGLFSRIDISIESGADAIFGALGIFLIILGRKVLSELRPCVELCAQESV